jgi:hypothetical protein
MQNIKPIAFYSRKLNPAQCKYRTGESKNCYPLSKQSGNIKKSHRINYKGINSPQKLALLIAFIREANEMAIATQRIQN